MQSTKIDSQLHIQTPVCWDGNSRSLKISFFNTGSAAAFYILPHSVSPKEMLPGGARQQAHLYPKHHFKGIWLLSLLIFFMLPRHDYTASNTSLSEIYPRAFCASYLEYFSCVPGIACHGVSEALDFWEVLSCGNAEKELSVFFQPLPVCALIRVRIAHLARAAGSLQTNPVTSVPLAPLRTPDPAPVPASFRSPWLPALLENLHSPFTSSQNPPESSWLPLGPLKSL